MRRLPKIVATRPLRKAVSVAGARAAAVAARTAAAEVSITSPVIARVRDGLVLRVVKRKKSSGRSKGSSDAPGSC